MNHRTSAEALDNSTPEIVGDWRSSNEDFCSSNSLDDFVSEIAAVFSTSLSHINASLEITIIYLPPNGLLAIGVKQDSKTPEQTLPGR